MSIRALPLSVLVGRSPANCRKSGADDRLDALAASLAAVGQLTPLLVSHAPEDNSNVGLGADALFWIDDGGRRYDAFHRLREIGTIGPDHAVLCDIQDLHETLTRERSLAANVMRRDLHPVDECDAFEAMRAAGLSVEKIAADFAVTARQVRQRLRLTTLCPAVRDAWRFGKITTEIAQTMTLGTHAAQIAVLVEADRSPWLLQNVYEIRSRLLGRVTRGDEAEALYLGIDAYVAAGGPIEENLFEDHPLILDPALLKRLAREKMFRDGAAILAATGYGFCFARDDVEQAYTWKRIEPDFLPAERERLAAIQHEDDDLDDTAEDDQARAEALAAETAAIEQRAALRGATPAMRAEAGIFLGLSEHGTLTVEYGMLPPAGSPSADAKADMATDKSASPATPAPKADSIETAGSGRGLIRTILETTIIKALADMIGRRPDLALMLFVAQNAATLRNCALASCGLSSLDKPLAEGLLTRIASRPFDEAVITCAEAPLADLTAAFSLVIGHTIRIEAAALLTALNPLMRALAARGAPLRQAFVAAMDHDRFFEAATKAGCLRALELMAVDAVDKAAKKPLLAGQAAAAAKAMGWLPFPLEDWAAYEATSPEARHDDGMREISKVDDRAHSSSLAEAMDAAISAHESDKTSMRRFLERECTLDPAGKIKAGLLFELYKASGGTLALNAFGAEIASLDIAKKRTKDGWHYLGIALVDDRGVAA